MKTREEIERMSGATYGGTTATRGLVFLVLEVALDIRDLLTAQGEEKGG